MHNIIKHKCKFVLCGGAIRRLIWKCDIWMCCQQLCSLRGKKKSHTYRKEVFNYQSLQMYLIHINVDVSCNFGRSRAVICDEWKMDSVGSLFQFSSYCGIQAGEQLHTSRVSFGFHLCWNSWCIWIWKKISVVKTFREQRKVHQRASRNKWTRACLRTLHDARGTI